MHFSDGGLVRNRAAYAVFVKVRLVLFENVNDEGMRRRRCMALKHWASCIIS